MLHDEEQIKPFLEKENRHIRIICVKETTSTNDELKKLALSGEKNTVLYIAESQSAGKGRKGRSFFSPAETGIYMSILLIPEISPNLCTLITPLCAVAVTEAIENITGIKADIKWVNDIFVKGRKVAGILTEGSFSEKRVEYIIVGIGINLSRPTGGFPEELTGIAGALTEKSADIKNQLIAETVNRLMYHLSKIESRDFLEVYKRRLFFLGQEITVISPQEEYRAIATDIDSMCRLKVQKENGETITLNSGEISVKTTD